MGRCQSCDRTAATRRERTRSSSGCKSHRLPAWATRRHKRHIKISDYVSYLPHLNACLNGTSAVLLFSGYTFIRSRNVAAHRACQVSALVVSILFLASYLTYHYYHG